MGAYIGNEAEEKWGWGADRTKEMGERCRSIRLERWG